MAIDRNTEKAAAKPAAEKAADEPSVEKVADALDPSTGGGVQDVVQVPSVDKHGGRDQTAGHVVLDPAAAEAADRARAEAGVPTAADGSA